MEPETILVLVLSAGVVALLVWFEINSRRNEASKKQTPTLQSALGPLRKNQGKVESEIDKTKAAYPPLTTGNGKEFIVKATPLLSRR